MNIFRKIKVALRVHSMKAQPLGGSLKFIRGKSLLRCKRLSYLTLKSTDSWNNFIQKQKKTYFCRLLIRFRIQLWRLCRTLAMFPYVKIHIKILYMYSNARAVHNARIRVPSHVPDAKKFISSSISTQCICTIGYHTSSKVLKYNLFVLD
jgi:hypothetical protein